MTDPRAAVDGLLGHGIERAVKLHHSRRLRRLGHAGALEPVGDRPWAATGTPPREGNELTVLIDGAEAFAAIAEAIAGARSHVHLTGWHLAPHLELVRDGEPVVLGPLLAEAAQRVDVRVLVWAGAPLPAFHPTRKEVQKDVEQLVRDTRIHCRTDPREHPFHCHHEKTVVVDDEVAFVGGIDMTDLAGDRFDVGDHPARRRLGWHDVGTCLRGPAVADVASHFVMRWHEVTGEQLPAPRPRAPAGPSTVQIARTISEVMYDSVPRGEFGILEGYLRALTAASHYVYLENQFLWAPEIVDVLVEKLRRPPSDDFRLVVLLPRRANNGQDDTKGQVARLIAADDGADRFLAATIRSRSGGRTDPLYVHAKVGIIDDRWMTVGSANLNAHSLLNDTEMNVITDDAALARATRERLWAEHLELPLEQLAGVPPCEVIDRRWIPIARAEAQREEEDRPPEHRLIALPGMSRRSRRLLGPIAGLVDDG